MKITTIEKNYWNGIENDVEYKIVYIVRRISMDGLLKKHEDVTEDGFESMKAALEECAKRRVYGVVILPFVDSYSSIRR